MPDTAHGMNGNEQFAYFFVGTGAGLAVTLLASSMRNWALGAGQPPPPPGLPPGLDVLRQSNYIRALNRSLRKLRLRHRLPGNGGSRTDVFPTQDVDGSIPQRGVPDHTSSRRRAEDQREEGLPR